MLSESSNLALGVFARRPAAGRSKTRLAPALGADGAAALYDAFLTDTLARFTDATVFCADAADLAWFEDRHPGHRHLAQAEADLGERMRVALETLLEEADGAVVIGSDAPTLPAARVHAAGRALSRGADVVLGPAADGGYYLYGCRGEAPALPDVRWSSRHALADTVASLERAGRTPALLAPWYDVDTPEDLRLLRAHLALTPRVAPETARALFDRLSPA